MKKILMVLMGVLLVSGLASAGEGEHHPTSTVSTELKKVAELAGRWEGASQMHGPEEGPTVVEYKVTSGGSAVVETLGPGTPHEMVSVYHDTDGKLSMTHYCMLGNHPELELKSNEGGAMTFEASDATRQKLAGQMYMSGVVLKQDGPNQLTQTWSSQNAEGVVGDDKTVLALKRVR